MNEIDLADSDPSLVEPAQPVRLTGGQWVILAAAVGRSFGVATREVNFRKRMQTDRLLRYLPNFFRSAPSPRPPTPQQNYACLLRAAPQPAMLSNAPEPA